ncbi:hypothetical protein M426DRAFT_19519 [Hypoxylon sp. CI-4A]|nr:hypothetical protein M426DRAFT_19519 [Hypoxylon sp. CI-4A]
MSRPREQYAGLEPTMGTDDAQGVLEDTSFDNPEIISDFFIYEESAAPVSYEPNSHQEFDPLPSTPEELRVDVDTAYPLEPLLDHPETYHNYDYQLDDPSLAAVGQTQEPFQDYMDPRTMNINPLDGSYENIPGDNYSYDVPTGHAMPNYPNDTGYVMPNYADNFVNNYPPSYEYMQPPPAPAYPMPSMVGEETLPDPQREARRDSSVDLGVAPVPRRPHKIPSPVISHQAPPLRRPSKTTTGHPLKYDKLPRVTRKGKSKPDPRDWYGDPQAVPESWGPPDKNNRPLFKYTQCGEMERNKAYTVNEMRWYLFGPKPLEKGLFQLPKLNPGVSELEGKVRQGLTLWIGWVAPQSNDRYPFGAQSQRCRFADCADPNRTIRSGFPRVIMDEWMNVDGEAIDPFHNAGYAHLYCFEKHFDLVHLMLHCDVRMDDRDFKREDNLGKLSRLYPEIQNDVDDWWRKSYDEWKAYENLGEKRGHTKYENTLGYRLVKHTIEHASEGRARMREDRGGADIGKHMGDLCKQHELKEFMQYGLVDENCNPVPNAKEKLKAIYNAPKGAKSKQKAKGRKPSNIVIAAGHQLQPEPSDPRSGFSMDFLPLPTSDSQAPTVSGQSHPSSGSSPTVFSTAQTLPSLGSPDLPTPLPKTSGEKRGRDEVEIEDWRQNVDPVLLDERPEKRQRQEPATQELATQPQFLQVNEHTISEPIQPVREDGLPPMDQYLNTYGSTEDFQELGHDAMALLIEEEIPDVKVETPPRDTSGFDRGQHLLGNPNLDDIRLEADDDVFGEDGELKAPR